MSDFLRPQGILFDRGGVLVHHHDDGDPRTPSQRFADWMAEQFDLDPHQWLAAMKNANVGYDIGRLNPLDRLRHIARDYHWLVPSTEISCIIGAEYRCHSEVARLDPHVGIVRELRQRGVRVGLCSNASPNEAGCDALLGLHDFIPSGGYSFQLRVAKPDPQAYLRAMKLLGLSDVSRIWLVDDGGDGSLQGARRVGATPVYDMHPSAAGELEPALVADYDGELITGLPDLLRLLDYAKQPA